MFMYSIHSTNKPGTSFRLTFAFYFPALDLLELLQEMLKTAVAERAFLYHHLGELSRQYLTSSFLGLSQCFCE